MEEIVHIIPLGFERDRVVKPLQEYPVSRVHILTVDSEKHGHELFEKQKQFTEAVVQDLKNLGSPGVDEGGAHKKTIEVRVHDTDIFDILDVMEKMSSIIKEEKDEGSIMYVNISGAGRLTAVASTLTSMYHGLKTYYVKADRYLYGHSSEEIGRDKSSVQEHGLSIVEDNVDEKLLRLENFRIERPNEEGIAVLKLLDDKGALKTDEIITHLSDKFERYDFEGRYKNLNRSKKQKLLMRLNRGVLDKLEGERYIKRKKLGRRNIIEINDQGKYISKIS